MATPSTAVSAAAVDSCHSIEVTSAEVSPVDAIQNASSARVATEAAYSGMHTAAEYIPASVTGVAHAAPDYASTVSTRHAHQVSMRKTVDNITGSVRMIAEVLPGKWVVSSEPAGEWAGGEL